MNCLGKDIPSTPIPLSLPSFLLTRQQIKNDYLHHRLVTEHIRKNRKVLIKDCTPTEEFFKRKPSAALDSRNDSRVPCKLRKYINVKRNTKPTNSWQLPPNLYDTLKVPFACQKGLKGAYWKKLLVKDKEQTKHVEPVTTSIQRKSNKTSSFSCNQYKGVFYSNARNKRSTSRLMVNDLSSCWRDPNDPGPYHYVLGSTFTAAKWKSKKEDVPNPYKFYPYTTVPEREVFGVRTHLSSAPGPGRYQIFVQRGCIMCTRRYIQPFITQEIEKQKRLKFRRFPYKKINIKKYCDTQFSHIPGHGHARLFKIPKAEAQKAPNKKPVERENVHEVVRYADARYLTLINKPKRLSLLRYRDSHTLPVKIVFNCMAKRVKRKHLRNNKKIAFNSGQPRWKDDERSQPMTVSQLEQIKLSLPPERRLYDHPVLEIEPEEIKSKLHETPPHMRPAYDLGIRKTVFKFKPIPLPKVLVLEQDVRPLHVDGKYTGDRLFFSALNPQDFFKDKKEEDFERKQSALVSMNQSRNSRLEENHSRNTRLEEYHVIDPGA